MSCSSRSCAALAPRSERVDRTCLRPRRLPAAAGRGHRRVECGAAGRCSMSPSSSPWRSSSVVDARDWRALASPWRVGPPAAPRCATATLAALAYLWFLVVWGLNYARPPIDVRLALATSAPTDGDVAALLDEAIAAANRLHGPARGRVAAVPDTDADIAAALHAVEARHGRPRPTVTGRPKPTLLAPYFRMAGVDGLTAPLALETLLNPDLDGGRAAVRAGPRVGASGRLRARSRRQLRRLARHAGAAGPPSHAVQRLALPRERSRPPGAARPASLGDDSPRRRTAPGSGRRSRAG